MSEMQMHEVTEAEMREVVIMALRFARRTSFKFGALVALNFVFSAFNAWTFAHMVSLHWFWVAAMVAAGVLLSVWSAGRCWSIFIRSFRMWQLHCLMLETFAKPPTDR